VQRRRLEVVQALAAGQVDEAAARLAPAAAAALGEAVAAVPADWLTVGTEAFLRARLEARFWDA
jgi:hypothetical protein